MDAAVNRRDVDTLVDVRIGVPLVGLLAGVEGHFGEATGVFLTASKSGSTTGVRVSTTLRTGVLSIADLLPGVSAFPGDCKTSRKDVAGVITSVSSSAL